MGGNPGKVLEFFFENVRSNSPKFENDLKWSTLRAAI